MGCAVLAQPRGAFTQRQRKVNEMQILNEVVAALIKAVADEVDNRGCRGGPSTNEEFVMNVIQRWWEKIDLDHTHISDLIDIIDGRVKLKDCLALNRQSDLFPSTPTVKDDVNAGAFTNLYHDVQELKGRHERMLEWSDDFTHSTSASLKKMEGRVAALSETSVGCGVIKKFEERITALAETNDQDFVEIRKQVDTLDERVDKLTGATQKLDNRFDNLRVLAADSAELTNMSIRLDRLSTEINQLRFGHDHMDKRLEKLTVDINGILFAQESLRQNLLDHAKATEERL